MVIEIRIQGGESEVEVYYILTEEELTQRLKKKTKKAQKKSSDAGVCGEIDTIVAYSVHLQPHPGFCVTDSSRRVEVCLQPHLEQKG